MATKDRQGKIEAMHQLIEYFIICYRELENRHGVLINLERWCPCPIIWELHTTRGQGGDFIQNFILKGKITEILGD